MFLYSYESKPPLWFFVFLILRRVIYVISISAVEVSVDIQGHERLVSPTFPEIYYEQVKGIFV